MVQQRILMASATNQFVFSCTPRVKNFLLHEGTDPKYGARHLKRAIERHVVFQLANLVATSQVKLGDFVRIDLSTEGRLTFVKEVENAMVRMLLERYGAAAGVSAVARATRTVASRRELGATGTLDGEEKLGSPRKAPLLPAPFFCFTPSPPPWVFLFSRLRGAPTTKE